MRPPIYRIRQRFPRPRVPDVEKAVKRAVDQALSHASLPPGAKIGITAGSRGIAQIEKMLRWIVERLKDKGYAPFLFASMGSHGGGEAEGQRKVLQSLGITPETMKAPVLCSSEVVRIGTTQDIFPGLPVYVAKEAMEADGVLVVNRIKAHTSFHGEHESGLLKMMAVGMGRAKGASIVHSLGAGKLAEAIQAIADCILSTAPILGGIAIVENAYEETALIEGIPRERMKEEEKRLLRLSKSYMPSLPAKEIDLCLIQEMGKNYSGTGMDTNIIGRMRIQGVTEPAEPYIRYLGVLDLSEASHGNATGIGLADFTTERLVSKIDREATYLNCMTSGFVTRAAIPMTFANDEDLFRNALRILRLPDEEDLRLVILKNTLHIDELWVSKRIHDQIKDEEHIETVGGPMEIQFDERGDLVLA